MDAKETAAAIEGLRSELEKAVEAANDSRLYTPRHGMLWFNYAINSLKQYGTVRRAEELAQHVLSDGRRRNSKAGKEAVELYAKIARTESELKFKYNKERLDNVALLDEAIATAETATEILGEVFDDTEPAIIHLDYAARSAKEQYATRVVEMVKGQKPGISMEMLETSIEYVRDIQDPHLALDIALIFGPSESYGLFEDAVIWANQNGKSALHRLVMSVAKDEDPMKQALAPYVLDTALEIALPDVSEFDINNPEIDEMLMIRLDLTENSYSQQGIPVIRRTAEGNIDDSEFLNLLDEAAALSEPAPGRYMNSLAGLSELARISRETANKLTHPEAKAMAEGKAELYAKWQQKLNEKAFLGKKSDILTASSMDDVDSYSKGSGILRP